MCARLRSDPPDGGAEGAAVHRLDSGSRRLEAAGARHRDPGARDSHGAAQGLRPRRRGVGASSGGRAVAGVAAALPRERALNSLIEAQNSQFNTDEANVPVSPQTNRLTHFGTRAADFSGIFPTKLS